MGYVYIVPADIFLAMNNVAPKRQVILQPLTLFVENCMNVFPEYGDQYRRTGSEKDKVAPVICNMLIFVFQGLFWRQNVAAKTLCESPGPVGVDTDRHIQPHGQMHRENITTLGYASRQFPPVVNVV